MWNILIKKIHIFWIYILGITHIFFGFCMFEKMWMQRNFVTRVGHWFSLLSLGLAIGFLQSLSSVNFHWMLNIFTKSLYWILDWMSLYWILDWMPIHYIVSWCNLTRDQYFLCSSRFFFSL